MVQNRRVTALSVAAGLLSLSSHVDGFWRMPCRSRTGLARVDPIMNPGAVADHVHAIHGGGNLNPSSLPTDLQSSDCTSCEVTQDKSAYWTPSLHFLFSNGTSVVVPQVGGMLAYYLLYSDDSLPDGNITAFPEGFQMISGDRNLRNFTWPVPDPPKSEWSGAEVSQFALEQKALGFNCLNYAAAPEGSLYRHFMPDKDYLDANCLDGLRLELMFPSCWNGKDLDSADHRSHVAFPDLVMTGTCPEGYETKLPSLFYETIWDTYAFVGQDGQFVLSSGDPTGYGYHGDFMMGWDGNFLQQAVDECTNLSGEIQDCPLFNIQSDATAAQCLMEVPQNIQDDNAAGPRNGLAVDVPIQPGPGYATDYPIILADSSTYMPPVSAMTAQPMGVVPTLAYSPAQETTMGITTGAFVGPTSPIPAIATPTLIGDQVPTLTSATIVSVTTVAPGADAAGAADANTAQFLSISTMTVNGQTIEVVVEQVVVTVTASSPLPPSVAAPTPVGAGVPGGSVNVNPDGTVDETSFVRKRHAHGAFRHGKVESFQMGK